MTTTTGQVGNYLKYTGLTYADILKQVTDKLKADPRFDNFRESAIAQTINEIFTGTADLVNYYIERQAEESFFETSQRVSSAILNSRNLAYDITRPIPATTSIKIVITGNMQSKIVVGRKFQIPIFSKFTYLGNDYILQKGFTYTFTTEDAQDVQDDGDNYKKEISVDDNGDAITLIQGTIKSVIIDGTTNPQVGQIFQSYKIPDTSFSNYYGSQDIEDYPITRVWVGKEQTTDTEYLIDRRSLINDATIQGAIGDNNVKCCVIRTAVEGDVELKFGSARIAQIGANVTDTTIDNVPTTTFDNIYVQYLSTLGTKANLVGIIGDRIEYSSQIILSNNNITDNVVFNFVSNIIAGGDLETAESIKTNAPAIFYSLDRAVNGTDHINILKSLTSPIKIKNAIAWGEQEEAVARGVSAIVEMFNVAFFTCIGSLYNLEGDPTVDTFSVRTNSNRLDEAVLDGDFDQDALSSQYYFNIFVKNKVAAQLKEQIIHTWFWMIHDAYASISGNHDAQYFKQNYPDDMTIKFNYTSDKFLTTSELSASINVNVGSIAVTPADQGMRNIADVIQTQLQSVTDLRSYVVSGSETNLNWGQSAFSGITVTWDSTNRKYSIQTASSDPCYISSIIPDTTFIQELGLYQYPTLSATAPAEKQNININYNYISQKIMDVIAYLYKRGMITLKYIYCSPTIQSFRLAGNVYAEQLFSIDDLHKQINNAIYEFCDEHADFNVNLYLSNIIDIIENFQGIDHADVRFEPDIPMPGATLSPQTTFYYPGNYLPIDSHGTDAPTIYGVVNTTLNTELGIAAPDLSPIPFRGSWETFINDTRTMTPDEIQISSNPTLSAVNEREFLSVIISDMYDGLVSALGASTDTETKFQDTNDFITMVSDIHKDLTWLIRSNMIDSNGNIAPEYNITTNVFGVNTKTLFRGGFSLGNEIAKLNLEATSNTVPALIYQYK